VTFDLQTQLTEKAKEQREKSCKSSHALLFWLASVLVISVSLYLALHLKWRPGCTLWAPGELLELDEAGRVIRLSEDDLRWYLGRERTSALAAVLNDRTHLINDLESRVVRQSLMEFEIRFNSAGDLSREGRDKIKAFGEAARSGKFACAATLFTGIVGGWTDEIRQRVGEKAIFDLNYGLEELARLKQQQVETKGRILQPPLIHQIFWTRPVGALWEAIFWSFFGTLVNLLLNISQARANGRFRAEEKWISVSKLIYGPILSTVLILSIYFGVLDVGTEIRFWFLPLAGFLFGYHTRKTATVLDTLGTKLLGAASKSARRFEKEHAKAASHAATALLATTPIYSLSELKERIPAAVHATTVAAVLKAQSKT
jgi:hypothetical protein